MDSTSNISDLIVIGGGINGTGIALDAAGRGLNVVLCEQGDLASATSSNSSKLIHGGLRYLEHYDFRLVRESLAEREVLLHKAPHLIKPMRFRIPHRPHLRPAWMIRIGLFLYDNLSKRVTLKSSSGIRFGTNSALLPHIKRGFEYSDGWVDDSRLVVLNAVAAKQKGADIRTQTRCIDIKRVNSLWLITLENVHTGETDQVRARALVNAAGPWVSSLYKDTMQKKATKQVRLIKGSHIVVPRIHTEEEAYLLQNKDGRVVFLIPFEDKFTLIGTTDIEYKGDPSNVVISQSEIDYIIGISNEHFKHQLTAADVCWAFSGVRPLLDDESDSPQAVTRDYTFEIEAPAGMAPMLSVFGGKLTTYRKLSELAVNDLVEYFAHAGPTWTMHATLPGGDFKDQVTLQAQLNSNYPWLPIELCSRYVRSYGTLTYQILSDAKVLADLGQHFGAGLYALEVDYLVAHEWACDVEDILWRRSKLGLWFNATQQADLAEYLQTFNTQARTKAFQCA
ncbi:glycerol-3-phosphate dehydrogenase [Oceanospirillaceae bacterium]|nr:glycerol-3-phosphate dehydrogenase [Oceanospirillaceae bacterium]MDC1507043.1 glycerol-3-phosphate dehydrogenase [Oceanospirillaceae bacterium]